MEDLFNRMSGLSWEAINRTQLWNTRRPVWLQAIIHLVEPHVVPAVLELLDLLDSVSSRITACISIHFTQLLLAINAYLSSQEYKHFHSKYLGTDVDSNTRAHGYERSYG